MTNIHYKQSLLPLFATESDFTSEGFLLKRFVDRQERCSDIWSDNGTNFVGAAGELKKLFRLLERLYDAGNSRVFGNEWVYLAFYTSTFS